MCRTTEVSENIANWADDKTAELQEMTDTVNTTKHTNESVASDSRNTLTMLMPKSSSTTSSMSACLCVRLAVPPSSSRLISETCRSCDDEQMREEERCLCTCSEWTEKSVCSTRVLCVAYSSCRIWSTMELVRYETTDSFTSLKLREMEDTEKTC